MSYEDVEGWFDYNDATTISLFISAKIDLMDGDNIVEVGSFKGRSTVAICDILKFIKKNVKLVCVDTWEGSEEHQKGERHEDFDVVHGLLYEKFLHNTKKYSDIIIPQKMTSLEYAKLAKDRGNKFKFVFLDAAHDCESLTADLEVWSELIVEGGVLCGHDYTWPSVKQALSNYSEKHGVSFEGRNNMWWRLF